MASPSPSLKIQIIGGRVCLRCKGKTLLGDVNKHFEKKMFVDYCNKYLRLWRLDSSQFDDLDLLSFYKS